MSDTRPVDRDSGLPVSSVVEAVAAGGADVWQVHYAGIALREAGHDAIVLSVGDPDFETPPAIVEAAVEALRNGDTHYTIAGGNGPLTEAVAQLETDRLGRPVSPEEVVCAGGAQNALYSVFRCLLAPGDEAILLSPPYTMFPGIITSCGAKAVLAPLDVNAGFALDIDAIERAITPKTRVLLANFPHNPSGAVADVESMDRLVELCAANSIWLISDEAYCDLTYDEAFVSPGRNAHPHVIVVRSLSKSHAMTGWRLGWAVTTPSLASGLRDFVSHVTYGAPGFIQAAGVAAITGHHGEVPAMRAAYQERRDRFVAAISAIPKLSIINPSAGIFCMVDVRATGLSGGEFAQALLDEQMVSVLSGSAFALEIDGFVRVSLCTSAERLEEAADRMGRFVGALENLSSTTS